MKWVSDRNEHFLADAHGRDHVTTGAFALDADGRITGMRVEITAAIGSYFNQFGPFIPWLAITMVTGLYDIRTVHANCKGVFTNTVPTDAYRGAGRPEAAYFIERLMDEAAHVAGLSPVEIRRRNFIKPEQMPYKTVTATLRHRRVRRPHGRRCRSPRRRLPVAARRSEEAEAASAGWASPPTSKSAPSASPSRPRRCSNRTAP